jgi:hypothetical protein
VFTIMQVMPRLFKILTNFILVKFDELVLPIMIPTIVHHASQVNTTFKF